MSLPLYLICVNYNKVKDPLEVIYDYINCDKPKNIITTLLMIDNSDNPILHKKIDFALYKNIRYYKYPKKNKANAINYAISKLINEDDALIICIDNDINFNKDFLSKYYDSFITNGQGFFYGGSFQVNIPNNIDSNVMPFLMGSQLGKTDAEFIKMERMMFMGCSYAFLKSQWKTVAGFDVRFSPGSEYGLSAVESVFQKKLKHFGYKPFFITSNSVIHKPLIESYKIKNVLLRHKNNGYTHGFQLLISSSINKFYKKIIYLCWDCIVLLIKGNWITFRFKINYLTGYVQSLILYLKIEDKKSFLIDGNQEVEKTR